ncbi:UdgX family uracil-DNA binding protein [Sphingomonas profundi]|uniref:UdgX family uracil-DNA binding protein n=1 Tax=Alterirhizorhabdus profundi TaxID=2681549 RepID=UPI0012E97E3D|nr:UdgX family uracil-DNA binding protein [Sphingomonas profundi]
MRTVHLAAPDDFDGWRDAARALALARVPPEEIVWHAGDGAPDLFADEAVLDTAVEGAFSVPRAFVALARDAVCHADAERFALLYAMLLRLRDQPRLIEDHADPLLRRIEELAKAVRRDVHKMRAFLRFRELEEGDQPRFVAWFEPEHHIVRINAAFFVRRFATMRWSILTPELSLHWDGATLSEAPGASKADAPAGDPLEETWKTYYASIFNPARVKIGAMLKEMPKKYWKNMPETALVPQLIAGAQARESGMIAKSDLKVADAVAAEPPADVGGNSRLAWEALREEAAACTRCHLYKHATQTVFGEGPIDATLMFVGEQPGDQEDLAGKPFVGPAGQMFDRALAQAGVDRGTVYVTNAVKHFKFEQRGKRRIHAKPQGPEIEACRWWIEQERVLIRPPLTVALGATAARSLLGKVVTISGARGRPHVLQDGGEAWVTVHPSYLLRIPEREKAEEEYARFVADLRAAGARAKELA